MIEVEDEVEDCDESLHSELQGVVLGVDIRPICNTVRSH
jgi:hypothetical protein